VSEPTVIGVCSVTRRTNPNTGETFFEVVCPQGRAQVYRDKVYIYGPWERAARAYFDRNIYYGVEGRVSHVEPTTDTLAESFEDLGLIIGAEEPNELYEALEEKLGTKKRKLWFI
jgi:hypothetical protein